MHPATLLTDSCGYFLWWLSPRVVSDFKWSFTYSLEYRGFGEPFTPVFLWRLLITGPIETTGICLCEDRGHFLVGWWENMYRYKEHVRGNARPLPEWRSHRGRWSPPPRVWDRETLLCWVFGSPGHVPDVTSLYDYIPSTCSEEVTALTLTSRPESDDICQLPPAA